MKNTTLFGLSANDLESIVGRGLGKGGDWCDLFFEDSLCSELLLRDSEVSSGGCHCDYGCGIRVLSGEKTGYAYSQRTDTASLLRAADSAASIAGSTGCRTGYRLGDSVVSPPYGMQVPWENTSLEDFVPWLKKLDSEIRRRETRTVKVTALFIWSVSRVMMYNSLGELTEDERPLASVSVTAVFRQGDRTEQNNVSRSFRAGAEMVSDALLREIADELLKGLDARFEAKRPKGGKMSVVMGAGASGILLHEAMGHAFEADFNRKGQSVFADRMGERICRKGINIVDDATIPGNRGSILYDDEGIPGQKTYMVTDGVLTSYLHDRISAAFYGVAPTGNGRRENFRYNPIPRMRATYMESGTDGTAEELISGVRKGIYVDQFSNGEVKIGEGDFTFYVQRGFLIENGKLTMPVKDINIIGNGPQALADIVAVGSDLRVDNGAWTCGKGQSVPVSCGIPSVLIRNLTVGGDQND